MSLRVRAEPAPLVAIEAQLVPVEPRALAQADPVALLLADKRSEATKRAYASDLRDFFGGEATSERVRAFAGLSVPEIALRLNVYKGELLQRGAAEATVNRRLAAVRSLLKVCHRMGWAASDGRGLVDGEKARAYRDTRGVDVKALKKLLRAPGTDSLKGLRDTALLRLLCENAPRRAEVTRANVGDFSLSERRLYITGKGRGTQKEPLTLSQATADAIAAYLLAAGHAADPHAPLFRNLHHVPRTAGERLSAQGLYWLVGEYGRAVGIDGLTPHKLRHSAITAALDATGGDVRRVQKFSRHRDLRTLTVYDDNRTDHQGEITRTLSGLLEGGK